MPKEEWGTKRICPTTGKRFYDLKKNPIISPYTGDVITLDTGNKSRTVVAEKAVAKEKAPKVPVEEDETALEDDSADVDLDDDLLEDEDDDNVSLDEIADVPSEDEDS